MDTLAIFCSSPEGRWFGNSVPVDKVDSELLQKLHTSIDRCTKPEWPRILLRSKSPIRIVSFHDEPQPPL